MSTPDEQDLSEHLDAALRDAQHPLDALAEVLAHAHDAAKSNGHDRAATPAVSAGPWQLVRLLGMGGMGVTYEARGVGGEVAAVKITEIVTAAQRERFEAECQALLRLDHPRIVRYRGHGLMERGEGWLAMDLVVGQPLSQVLDEFTGERSPDTAAGRLLHELGTTAPFQSEGWQRRALRLVLAVAEGVALAHQRGIVHRDIKPANILMGEDLEPVLIDFGLSRNLFRAVSLTRSGDMLGTFAYMAPEQMASATDRADARTDVFALGILLHRLLLGRDLRESPEDLFRRRPCPFRLDRKAARQLPVRVQAILYRCLELKPRHRYANAGDLAEDLRAALGNGEVRARRPHGLVRWFRSPAALPCALGLLAAAATGAGIAAWPAEQYWLTVDGFIDPVHSVQIDDGPWQDMPLLSMPTTSGKHSIRVASRTIRSPILREFTIPAGRHHHRETILPVGSGEGRLWQPRGLVDAPGTNDRSPVAWLFVRAGKPCSELLLNGQPLPLEDHWWRVPAGPCSLLARSPLGEEVQNLVLSANEAHAVSLHGGDSPLAHVPGAFRRTIAALLSPMPSDIRLTDLDDGVVVFLNTKRDVEEEPNMQAKSVLTPVVAERTLRASLRVEFPGAMCSMVFVFSANENQGGALSFHWRAEGIDWRPIPQSDGGPLPPSKDAPPIARRHWLVPTTPELPSNGVRWLEVRATMRVAQAPADYSGTEAFIGIADPAGPVLPCFAVVADPRAGVATLK